MDREQVILLKGKAKSVFRFLQLLAQYKGEVKIGEMK